MVRSTIECYEDIYKNRCRRLCEMGLSYDELNLYENFKDVMSLENFKEVLKKKQNRKNKRYRYHKAQKQMYELHVNAVKNGSVVLGTLTINPENYDLKKETLRKKINEWLKKHFLYAIVYDDYGNKKGRLHYHFEGLTTETLEKQFKATGEPKKSKSGNDIYEFVAKDYRIGFEPTLMKIDLSKYDLKSSMNYILKLNNHSNKNSTKARFRVLKSPLMKLLEIRKER